MVKVNLFCKILGEKGNAFEVEIDDGKSVSAFHKGIKLEKPNALKDVDADELQLFLAKTADNKWLESDSEDVKKLKKGEKTPLIETLTDGELELQAENLISKFLADMETPKADQIHVLVVVPEGAVGSASETSTLAQMSSKIDDLHKRATLGKRTYVHSQVNSTEYKEILNDFKITVKPVRKAAAQYPQVDAFTWDKKLTEEKQQDEYREYVERNIGEFLQEKKLCVFGVEKSTDILKVDVKGLNIEFSGRTDLLILSDIVMESAEYALDLPEVKMLIEAKKKIERKSVYQAVSELIALDLLSETPVVALLTDFNSDWRFFWIAGKENNYTCINRVNITNPGEAFELIRNLLAQPPTTDAEIMIPVLQDPVKRQKLSLVLPSINEASESSGIRESIQRYYDIASMLGPDIDMARAVAMQVTRSIPTLSYFS